MKPGECCRELLRVGVHKSTVTNSSNFDFGLDWNALSSSYCCRRNLEERPEKFRARSPFADGLFISRPT